MVAGYGALSPTSRHPEGPGDQQLCASVLTRAP